MCDHTYMDLHALLMNNSTTTRRTENAFERRRQSASACLFSSLSGVALSRTVVGTIIQPSQTPTTHGNNTRLELTIITIPSFSERLAIDVLSYCERSELVISRVHQFGLECRKNCDLFSAKFTWR